MNIFFVGGGGNACPTEWFKFNCHPIYFKKSSYLCPQFKYMFPYYIANSQCDKLTTLLISVFVCFFSGLIFHRCLRCVNNCNYRFKMIYCRFNFQLFKLKPRCWLFWSIYHTGICLDTCARAEGMRTHTTQEKKDQIPNSLKKICYLLLGW